MNDTTDGSTASPTSETSALAAPACDPLELAALTPNAPIELLVREADRVSRILIDECARRGDVMVVTLAAAIEDDRYWQPQYAL